MYKLIAIDLDGTLVGPDLQILSQDRAAIERARDAGIHISLATGRGFPVTRSYAQDLQLTTPVICYQGGLMKDPQSGTALYEATIARNLYTEAVQLALEQNLDFTVYVGDTVYLREMRRPQSFHDRWFGLPIQQVDDLVSDVQQLPIKFLIIADEADADRIEPAWKAHFEGRLQVVRSHKLFVEGTPLGVSKGNALANLAQRLDVAQAEVIAIGDNDNDRSMVAWAGLGVAIGNAANSLKAIADYVAPAQSEAGVAYVIERFIFGEEN